MIAAVFALAMLAACDTHTPVEPGSLASLTVTPNVTLGINGTQQFVAVGRDADDNIVSIAPTWSVATGGGVISGTGNLTAGTTLGAFAVTATVGSRSASATATIVAGPLASITVTPDVTLAINGTQQFVAVGRDAGNNVVPITPTWSVAAGGGSINSTGLLTAGTTPGAFPVTATAGGRSGFATATIVAGAVASITVTPDVTLAINGTQQFVAVGRDAGNNVVPITPTWSVAAGGGSINSTGLLTAGTTPGAFPVTATAGGRSGFATATIVAGAVASITVTPNPRTLTPSQTQQFTAVARDAGNNVVPITPVWTVVNGGGAISGSGLFTAGTTVGTFSNTVRATSGAMSGTATVVVSSTTSAFLPLGAAASHGILAGTAVSCVTNGFIGADIGVAPGSTLTGFGPCTYSGVANLGNAIAQTAQNDLTTAYNTLAGLPCPPANAIVANLGGTTKAAGVYCSASGIGVTGTLTLDGGGDPNAVFVFQAGSSLTTAGNIVLINQAQAKNVYWQVGSSATIGSASQWQGNILALSSISLIDTATLLGRALARNGAVSLTSNNTITLP